MLVQRQALWTLGNIREQSLCLLYISQQNVYNCNGTPCSNPGKYLLPLVMLYLPLNKNVHALKKPLVYHNACCIQFSHRCSHWKTMPNWLISQSLLYDFLPEVRKRWGNLTLILLLYVFQFPPCEIQHSTFRRNNAGYFSEGFCEPRSHGPAGTHPVRALRVLLSALFRVGLQWLDNRSCLSLWSKATSHPPVPLTLLLGNLRQGTKTGLSFFSPHSPAKPVQRHLGRTTCNCLAVTVYI